MNQNTTLNQLFSRGRLPYVHEDGDNAAREEQTALRPEASSSKDYVNDSPGGEVMGRETPTLCKENSETQKKSIHIMDESPERLGTDEERQALSRHDMTLRRLKSLQMKKNEIWSGISKKQGIRIATLNVKGRNLNKKSKWPMIATLMRKQRILILGLQETHLDEEEAEMVRKMCPKIELISNGISKGKEGIAFAINKELANDMTWSYTDLIVGRATRLTIKVEEERGLNLILIYAPNDDNGKIVFFEKLKEKIDQEPEADNVVILGDFNSVEHELDRLPHRKDERRVVDSWSKIKKGYNLIDGWRLHNELTKGYTFIQPGTNSMSRIDRIYLNDNIYPYGYNWSHIDSAKLSDHELVAVDILRQKLPYIGKGLWRMNQDDIDDITIRKSTDKLLKKTEAEMKKIVQGQDGNIQELWMMTKKEIKTLVEDARKVKRNQLTKEKRKLKRNIEKKLKEINEENQELRERDQKEIAELKEKLARKSKHELVRLQEATRARYRSKGERYTKYWFKLNKKKVDDKVILALQKKDGMLTGKTKEMLNIALDHHKELQKRPEMTKEREEAIEELKLTSLIKASEDEKDMLSKRTSYNEVKTSLSKAPNGSAPGVDGIIYEFYKDKMLNHEKDGERPDMVGILHMVIQDIEVNGLKRMSRDGKHKQEFTDGIMHLVFKKKEKWKIANYRPITLLNTDYKTYTKTIALRLAEVAKSLINEDQAGFVPQRSIYDHTKTTNLAIEYCEMMDKNGCIIALDQEKAYDKIDHDYLWKMLEHYEFPKEFIGRIKELYKDTGKAIMVNGVVTKQYKVERGVHQGDPMSCLLYNFAIEPLADAIRSSSLSGIEVNTKVNRLIVSLFADDTLVYLRETDSLNDLQKIISTFCKASTARFNMEKTEYLPVGNKEYRKKVVDTRCFGDNEIEQGVKIIKDGEAMRTLGSWVGNETNADLQWEGVLRKQEETMAAWSKTNMSLKGREIILKALIQSKAMFLATVNGMPKNVEEKMKSMFKDFLWNGKKRGLMGWNQIIAEREQGGLGIPDVRARVEAIEIMWLKKWLAPNESKAKWTYILDEILKSNVAKAPMIDMESRISWIKQSWHETEAKPPRMSKGVRNILKVARKYNITLEPLKYDKGMKEKEPLWHNRLMSEANYQWNKKSARCIRVNHKVETIGDLLDQSSGTECENKKACNKMIRRLRQMIPEIIDPTKMTPRKVKARNLDLTPKRLKENKANPNRKIFNPDVTAKENVLEQVRLFSNKKGAKTRRHKVEPKKPAYRIGGSRALEKTRAKIVTLVQNAGRANQSTKISIALSGREKKKISFMLDKDDQSREKARAAAIMWVLQEERKAPLKIITTDKGLIKWLGEGILEAEEKDWLNVKEPSLWRSILNQLRKRNSETVIRIPGEREENKMKKMKRELRDETPQQVMLMADGEGRFLHRGAQLSKLSQKTTYEIVIQKMIDPPGGQKTQKQIEKLRRNLLLKWDLRVEKEDIWKEIERVNNKQIQDFIWKMIHDRVRCGTFFQHIPNWQDKQFCSCGEVESVSHILLECKKSKQKYVWKEVKKAWTKLTKRRWKKLTLNDIMTIGSIRIRNDNNTNNELATEVLVTLVTSAIWSIWKNRNNRIFNNIAETKSLQIDTWKVSLEREIKIEYELLKEVKRSTFENAMKRFLSKWSSIEGIAKIKLNKEGKKKLVVRV